MRLLLAILAVVASTTAAYADSSCLDELRLPLSHAEYLTAQMLEFRGGWLRHHEGFILRRDRAVETRVITLERVNMGGESSWHRELWENESSAYEFVDAGFRNLEGDAMRMNHVVLDHLERFPHMNLELRFSKSWQESENKISELRWAMHAAVLSVYHGKKDYLTPADFSTLNFVNRLSSNSDVFGLFLPSAAPFRERLQLTIQISYFGNRNFFIPTTRGVLLAAGQPIDETHDRLPFEFRLSKEDVEAFRTALYQRFDQRTSCEITRYTKFAADLPRDVTDEVVRRVFERVARRGIRTMFISVDPLTLRLFKRYGFKPYAELPINHTDPGKKEVLAYLTTDSKEFAEVYRRLAESSRSVHTYYLPGAER